MFLHFHFSLPSFSSFSILFVFPFPFTLPSCHSFSCLFLSTFQILPSFFSISFYSLRYFPSFPCPLPLFTPALSLSQPLPLPVPLPDLSFSSVSTHYLSPSPSLVVWSAVFLLTLHGLVWCARTGSCRLTHFTAQSSLQNRILLHKPLWFSFMATIFTLNSTCMSFFFNSWSACFPPPPFASSNERERERQVPWPSSSFLSSPLLSFHSFFPCPPPPLFLSASLNSPSLIQLPGRRDSACSDCFTPHGPPSPSGSPLLR